ncbi:hypothetical protein FZD47_02330 [Bacillus infantis]|uniref:Uncharacterized protein n=1 Tax=Bacillus infantis TaxID=324767 RepID=A0A5D4SSI9_9BACI|nr:hypothetical protein [Bacillus infantis]TYS66345.1 hypothetical protein FZD47_02330 [Bacillus infantis]
MNVTINITSSKEEQQKVAVPIEVYQAFERLKRSWSSLMPKEELNFLFLNIQLIGDFGDALTLKRFSRDNPTQYAAALAHGWKPQEDVQLAANVKNFLKQWLEDHGASDDPEAQREFANKVTLYMMGHFAKQK